MKVAVTSQGAAMDCPVDGRFGRAKYFIIFDTGTGETFALNNAPNLNAPQGAGVQAARNVIKAGVEAVVTGNVGPKAFAALRAAAIEVYVGASGAVGEAVEKFKAGGLECAGKADVEGHWI